MQLNELKCTVKLQGREFTNRGAYVSNGFAHVYVKVTKNKAIIVTDWHGNKLGAGIIVSEWYGYGHVFGSYRMVSVRFVIDGVYYAGRLNIDGGELVRAKAVKSQF